MFKLVRFCGPPLDLNSEYLYFLIGAHFSETSAVAEQDGAIIGFISAYILPDRRDWLFIWQVAVCQKERGKGLAQSMLEDILSRSVCREIKYIETTVNPSNEASRQLFKRFALRRNTPCQEDIFLTSEDFKETDHEKEIRLMIGPFKQ